MCSLYLFNYLAIGSAFLANVMMTIVLVVVIPVALVWMTRLCIRYDKDNLAAFLAFLTFGYLLLVVHEVGRTFQYWLLRHLAILSFTLCAIGIGLFRLIAHRKEVKGHDSESAWIASLAYCTFVFVLLPDAARRQFIGYGPAIVGGIFLLVAFNFDRLLAAVEPKKSSTPGRRDQRGSEEVYCAEGLPQVSQEPTTLRLKLDSMAERALGQLSPQAAWVQVVAKVVEAVEDQEQESQRLAVEMGLYQPEWETDFQDLRDLLDMVVVLSPVRGINNLHYINPQLDLEKIQEMKPLAVLEAVIRIFTESDLWARTP